MTAATVSQKGFLSGHRTGSTSEARPGLKRSDLNWRLREAQHLYSSHDSEQRGAEEVPIATSATREGDCLTQRAERRVGKKSIILQARLEQSGYQAGESVRIKVKVKNHTQKVLALIKVHLVEREVEGSFSTQRKGIVEEYMLGGVFPMKGESRYSGTIAYLLPQDTRASNMWRSHELWVGVKIKGSISNKLWVAFPLRVGMEGQLVAETDPEMSQKGTRHSVSSTKHDPEDDARAGSLRSSSSSVIGRERRKSMRGITSSVGQSAKFYKSADNAVLTHATRQVPTEGRRTLRITRTLSLSLPRGWFAKEIAKYEGEQQNADSAENEK